MFHINYAIRLWRLSFIVKLPTTNQNEKGIRGEIMTIFQYIYLCNLNLIIYSFWLIGKSQLVLK